MVDTIKNIIVETIKNARDHQITFHGAAIAFYAIFSTAPLIVIIIFSLSIFIDQQQTSQLVAHYLEQLINPGVADFLINLTNTPPKKTAGIIASTIATAILLFGATTVITQLRKSLNHIWGVTHSKLSSVKLYLWNRLLALVTILLVTTLFVASLLAEGTLNFFGELFFPYLPDFMVFIIQLGTSLFSILISILFFALIFKLLSAVYIRWKDLLAGACVTTALFLIGKYLTGLYFASISLQDSYKAAGAFVVFLIWIYYNVQIVLAGAEFTRTYITYFEKPLHPKKKATFTSPKD